MLSMVGTRLDLAYLVSLISNDGKEHWDKVKWIMRYFKGTSDYGIVYKKNIMGEVVKGYTTVDFSGNLIIGSH